MRWFQKFIKYMILNIFFFSGDVYMHWQRRKEETKYLYYFSYPFIPHHKKSGGVLCYTLRTVWVLVHPSVSASFPDSNLSSFWPICFKLCMDMDIREEWFGIANGLNLFINDRVMALDWCKNVFFLNIFRTNGWILIKFCKCIDIYKIHVVSLMHITFGRFVTELWPLTNVRILLMLNILWINLWISIKFCVCVDIDKT